MNLQVIFSTMMRRLSRMRRYMLLLSLTCGAGMMMMMMMMIGSLCTSCSSSSSGGLSSSSYFSSICCQYHELYQHKATHQTQLSNATSNPVLKPLIPQQNEMEGTELALQSDRNNKSTATAKNPNRNNSDDYKIILFWTQYVAPQPYGFGHGNEPFIKANCPVSNCLTTSNRDMYKQASAIIFHIRTVNSKAPLPSVRFPNQTYIFLEVEPPCHAKSQHGKIFNLTMTYRRDSDIYIPYGQVIESSSGQVLADNSGQVFAGTSGHLLSGASSAHASEHIRNVVRGKTKMIAWFVSNCKSYSKREQYVRELQKYVDVDIYGPCGGGKFSCSRKNDAKCTDTLEKTYRFYLSFENSVCKDYVTEKLFKVLAKYVVPVVYGGANYSAHTPPRSVINVQDFTSPKHLAAFLLELAHDERRYVEYFDWKQRYHVITEGQVRKRGFCELCERLNRPQVKQTIHKDLKNWWENDAKCNTRFINTMHG